MDHLRLIALLNLQRTREQFFNLLHRLCLCFNLTNFQPDFSAVPGMQPSAHSSTKHRTNRCREVQDELSRKKGPPGHFCQRSFCGNWKAFIEERLFKTAKLLLTRRR